MLVCCYVVVAHCFAIFACCFDVFLVTVDCCVVVCVFVLVVTEVKRAVIYFKEFQVNSVIVILLLVFPYEGSGLMAS